jgi:hypothetical protein
MILSRTLDGSPPESFELCCSVSGRYRRRSDQQGLLQNSSDIRSGIYCTFYLSVNVYDNAIYVKGCASHFGHQTEVLISSPIQRPLHTQASSTSGDETVEENQNICPIDEDAKSDQLVIVEDEQVVVDDEEDKRTPDFQRELRRIALVSFWGKLDCGNTTKNPVFCFIRGIPFKMYGNFITKSFFRTSKPKSNSLPNQKGLLTPLNTNNSNTLPLQ